MANYHVRVADICGCKTDSTKQQAENENIQADLTMRGDSSSSVSRHDNHRGPNGRTAAISNASPKASVECRARKESGVSRNSGRATRIANYHVRIVDICECKT
jgi:hypothetical protein